MAGDARKLQPIIIKRIKKGGHGHHGGAWKIAYADFVTAMMAFFLLMWLLGSTSEGDKKGIADFFNSPLKVAMSGGSGAGDATSIVKGGGDDLSRQTGQVKKADPDAQRRSAAKQQVRQEQRRAESARLDALKDKVRNLLATTPKLSAVRSQVRLDTTPDGLRIQIVDEQSRAMFDSGSAALKPWMRDLLRLVADVLAEVPNRIVIEGHTDAAPFARNGGAGNAVAGYGNWELSSDRANASRRELVAGGLSEARVLRVLGLAASLPYDPADAAGAVNRRIGIVVLNRDAEDRLMQRPGLAVGPEADGVAAAASAPAAAPSASAVTSAMPAPPRALPAG